MNYMALKAVVEKFTLEKKKESKNKRIQQHKREQMNVWKSNNSKSLFGAVMFCRETLRPSLSLMASFVKAGTFIVSNIYCVRLIFNHLSQIMMMMMGGMMADRP